MVSYSLLLGRGCCLGHRAPFQRRYRTAATVFRDPRMSWNLRSSSWVVLTFTCKNGQRGWNSPVLVAWALCPVVLWSCFPFRSSAAQECCNQRIFRFLLWSKGSRINHFKSGGKFDTMSHERSEIVFQVIVRQPHIGIEPLFEAVRTMRGNDVIDCYFWFAVTAHDRQFWQRSDW